MKTKLSFLMSFLLLGISSPRAIFATPINDAGNGDCVEVTKHCIYQVTLPATKLDTGTLGTSINCAPQDGGYLCWATVANPVCNFECKLKSPETCEKCGLRQNPNKPNYICPSIADIQVPVDDEKLQATGADRAEAEAKIKKMIEDFKNSIASTCDASKIKVQLDRELAKLNEDPKNVLNCCDKNNSPTGTGLDAIINGVKGLFSK